MTSPGDEALAAIASGLPKCHKIGGYVDRERRLNKKWMLRRKVLVTAVIVAVVALIAPFAISFHLERKSQEKIEQEHRDRFTAYYEKMKKTVGANTSRVRLSGKFKSMNEAMPEAVDTVALERALEKIRKEFPTDPTFEGLEVK